MTSVVNRRIVRGSASRMMPITSRSPLEALIVVGVAEVEEQRPHAAPEDPAGEGLVQVVLVELDLPLLVHERAKLLLGDASAAVSTSCWTCSSIWARSVLSATLLKSVE